MSKRWEQRNKSKEIAQPAQCLPYKPEDLNSSPWNYKENYIKIQLFKSLNIVLFIILFIIIRMI